MSNEDYTGIVERRSSLTSHEEDIFLRVFEELVGNLQFEPKFAEIQDCAEWMKKVLCYNVPDGKQIRGRCVVSTYRMLVGYDPTEEGLHLASILGWTTEIFQACYLIADDIMDGSEIRRSKPCWHLRENTGKSAINDAFLLHGFIYQTLEKYFKEKTYYPELIRLFNDMFFKTALGQCADTKNSKEIYSSFSMSVYSKIVKYKTSYYTFYLPVASAMIMGGITDEKLLQQSEDVLLEIGHLFQVQDDYLDCYGDPNVFGKVGNDIKENKCSWLVVRALEIADHRQMVIIKENYGRGKRAKPENIQKVKEIYAELQMDKEFRIFETGSYLNIMAKIQELPKVIPSEMYRTILELIYTRKK